MVLSPCRVNMMISDVLLSQTRIMNFKMKSKLPYIYCDSLMKAFVNDYEAIHSIEIEKKADSQKIIGFPVTDCVIPAF